VVQALTLAFMFLITVFGIAPLLRGQERVPPTLRSDSKLSATPQPSPSATSASKQQAGEDEVVRVDTNLVTIPASIMDRDGRYITDLRKEDFQIFEDGVEQEVAVFVPVEQPFTILFLLDVSGSMTYKMEDLGRAANTFVSQLRPDDKLIAASFDDWVKVLFEPTKISNLPKRIKLRSGGKGTLLYDAVDFALKRMRKVQGRNAIVLFSDGMGEGIFATAKGNLHDAEEQDALIYTVQFNTYPTALPPGFGGKQQYYESLEAADNYMRGLAQKTGGRHYQVENIADLEKTFGLVADELRRQYSLGYYPRMRLEAGQRRQIKVKVRLPNLVVQARDSYIAKSLKKTR
jgi:Ca-activated chloride channel family protein